MTRRAMLALGLTGLALVALMSDGRVHAQADERPHMSVKAVDDFDVTGTGQHAAWRQADLDMVKSQRFRDFLKTQGFTLVKWKDLARARTK